MPPSPASREYVANPRKSTPVDSNFYLRDKHVDFPAGVLSVSSPQGWGTLDAEIYYRPDAGFLSDA